MVDAEVSETEKQMNLLKMEHNVDQVTTGAPLDRQFAPIPDTFRGKPTGLKRLTKSCEWCDFIKPCYPKAKYMPHPKSEAKNPPMYWFIEDD